MSIFVTGDTHGAGSSQWGSVNGFLHRFSTEAFPEQKRLTKDDYVIVCGDFGGIWATNRNAVKETGSERWALDWLEDKPFTTLFIPGNHENYDVLMGCKNEALLNSWFYAKMPDEEKEKLKKGYLRKEWNGGYVREIRPSVLMLENGYVFNINGRNCFTFGGARSHDIEDGILDPAAYPNEKAFIEDYARKKNFRIRVKGVSWWEEEMSSQEEMDRGLKNLHRCISSGEKITFIFSHDAPASDKIFLGCGKPDKLNLYLEKIKNETDYFQWFYGHLHDNRKVFEKDFLLYEQILQAW